MNAVRLVLLLLLIFISVESSGHIGGNDGYGRHITMGRSYNPGDVSTSWMESEELTWWEFPDGSIAWLPADFTAGAMAIIPCESGWETNKVGALGELGWFQILPLHFPEMRDLNLDPNIERDRVIYAAHKHHYAGWRPWVYCGKRTGLLRAQ